MRDKTPREQERAAVKRAARKAGGGAPDLAASVRYASHRAPDSSKAELARGIIQQLRRNQAN